MRSKNRNLIARELGLPKYLVHYHTRTPEQIAKTRVSMKKARDKMINKKFYTITQRIKSFQKKGQCTEPFTLEQFIQKYTEFPICYLTGIQLNINDGPTFELDHIIPLNKGGLSILANCAPVHPMANRMKVHYYLKDFIDMCKKISLHHKDS